MNNLNKETLKYALENNWFSATLKGEWEKARTLGWMEANLIAMGVLKIGVKFPYTEGEHYEDMILRLAKEATK